MDVAFLSGLDAAELVHGCSRGQEGETGQGRLIACERA